MIIRLLRDTNLMASVRGVPDSEHCFVSVSFAPYSLEFFEDVVVFRPLFFYDCFLFLSDFPELGVLRGERIIAVTDRLFEGGKV